MKKRRRRKLKQKIHPLFYALPIVLIVIAVALLIYNILSPFQGTSEVTYAYDENRPLHTYDLSLIQNTNGIYTYEDSRYRSELGIDVSYHNGEVDWQAVKDAGMKFVMIRVGYRGYSEGQINLDERFEQYIQGAENAGLDVGVYFFSQAINEEEAREEAAFTVNTIDKYEITMPVAYDFETVEWADARGNHISVQQRTKNAVVFAENVKEAGYTPMIYASSDTYDALYDYRYLTTYATWIAQYNEDNTYPYSFSMWQYSKEGIENTALGGMDLNIAFIPK